MSQAVIICVDDEITLLSSLQMELISALEDEYIIETAESGEDALEIVEELLEEGAEIPLIISDQLMPGMKGDKLLQKIHAITPKTLKILLTGHTGVDAVGRAVNNANLYRYISKPWEQTNFLIMVKEAIAHYFKEKKLVQLYADSEKTVIERTRELRDKNERLSIALHDLKNILSAIQGFAEMIKNDEMPKENVINLADRILTTSKHLLELGTCMK
ncbi:MAG: response regulator [Thiomargarita sp.]|nr:response regulator [Thiomargarita sp.]